MAGIQNIRKHSSGFFAKIIAGSIIVTFALFFGWGTVFTGSNVNNIAKINGNNINVVDLSFETRTQQYLYNQKFQDQILDPEILRTLATTSLIRREVILQYLKDLGISIPDQIAYASFKDDQSFELNGEFNQERFEAVLRAIGFTTADYIKRVKEDISLNFWRTSLIDTEFLPNYEALNILQLSNQTRDVSFVNFKIDKFKQGIIPTQDQIKLFYLENKDKFMQEEQMKARYLELSSDLLREGIVINKEDVEKEYQYYLDNFKREPMREASHIEIKFSDEISKNEALELANKISQEIQEKGNFLEMVVKYSEDTGTVSSEGDLGVSDGTAFPAEFEESLINMKVGEISSPIVLENSIHILFLKSYDEPIPASFASLKTSFEESLIESQLSYEYSDLIDNAGDLMDSSNDLSTLSSELKIPIVETEFLSKNSIDLSLVSESIKEVIFSDVKFDGISDIIEINENLAFVFEVLEIKEAYVKSFEDLEAEVNILLKDKLAMDKLEEALELFYTRLNNIELQDLVKDQGLNLQSYKSVSRQSSLLPGKALTDLFQISRGTNPSQYFLSRQNNGDVIVLFLDEIHSSNSKEVLASEENLRFIEILENERSNLLLSEVQTNLQDLAKITFYD